MSLPPLRQAVAVPVFRSWERAATSWAGAKGLLRRMPFGTPFEAQIVGTVAGHIGNGKFRVDLSGAAGDVPAVHFVSPKILVARMIRLAPSPHQQAPSGRPIEKFQTASQSSKV